MLQSLKRSLIAGYLVVLGLFIVIDLLATDAKNRNSVPQPLDRPTTNPAN